jgi:hypothetical protein
MLRIYRYQKVSIDYTPTLTLSPASIIAYIVIIDNRVAPSSTPHTIPCVVFDIVGFEHWFTFLYAFEALFYKIILFSMYLDFLEGHNLCTPPFTPFPLLLWLVPPLPLQSVNSL